MKSDGQGVCIVTADAELGESLREIVQTTNPSFCTVVPALACVERLGNAQKISMVFLDRSLDREDLEKHGGLLDAYAVITFGDTTKTSEIIASIESSAVFQLPHPANHADLQTFLDTPGSTGHGHRSMRAIHSSKFSTDLVGECKSVQDLKSIIERVAPSKANILVLGETGSGKEVVARCIHSGSTYSGGPFVPVNCSAIPADLLESELFGHKKGAFTGAICDRIGRFELASGGTLFLDEIGDMPLILQIKLLRVLEERIIYPLGGDSGVAMTARLVAATHRDLDDLVARGKFREDLYYRLNVVPVTVPPLRDRAEDIPRLVNALSFRLQHEQNASVEFSHAAFDLMQRYRWPGNVRELANLVERLTVLHPNGCIDIDDLPRYIRGINDPIDSDTLTLGPAELPVVLNREDFDLREHLKVTETALIRKALESSDGVITKAAKILQVRRTTLTEKVKRLGLGEMVK